MNKWKIFKYQCLSVDPQARYINTNVLARDQREADDMMREKGHALTNDLPEGVAAPRGVYWLQQTDEHELIVPKLRTFVFTHRNVFGATIGERAVVNAFSLDEAKEYLCQRDLSIYEHNVHEGFDLVEEIEAVIGSVDVFYRSKNQK